MQFNKYTHTHTHIHTHTQQVSLIPPWEDQCEWHRMTRMTGPDCAVMCNLINTHTHTHHTHTHTHHTHTHTPHTHTHTTHTHTTHTHTHTQVSLIPPWEDQCEWHRMTRMTGPDYAVLCDLINMHTHTHTHTNKYH